MNNTNIPRPIKARHFPAADRRRTHPKRRSGPGGPVLLALGVSS